MNIHNNKMNKEVMDILTRVGAILPNGHFIGTSGRHFDTYITKDALFPHTDEVRAICKIFAEQNMDLNVDMVVSPALGGLILSQWVAYFLSELKGREVLAVFTEKTSDNNQILTRGYDKLVFGKKILVIEDFTTTGASVKKVIESVKTNGGDVLRVCVMVNKNPKEVTEEMFGVPFLSLAELVVENFTEETCPLCKNGIPINTTVGHGKKYLEKTALS